jgi:hypothetical protein
VQRWDRARSIVLAKCKRVNGATFRRLEGDAWMETPGEKLYGIRAHLHLDRVRIRRRS